MELLLTVLFACLVKCSIGEDGSKTCLPIYKRFSKTHTLCIPPNPSCSVIKSGIDDEQRQTILKEHNAYRKRIATGEETTYPLPKAMNMLEMVWDPELESLAQAHSNQCEFKHDCNECRAVRDFSVGQNLFMQMFPNEAPKKPDWKLAVKSWYEEVKDFKKDAIAKFQSYSGPATGHFTQVVWAESWRLGCGYSVYKEGEIFKELYTCNYGPAGNLIDAVMYEEGDSCGHCPVNSCCGPSCKEGGEMGLCKVDCENAPYYNSTSNYIFHCSFREETDCRMEVTSGEDKWEIVKTLSGSICSIVLEGGQSSVLNFTTPFKSEKPQCVHVSYRKGPMIAGDTASGKASEIFLDSSNGRANEIELQGNYDDFTSFLLGLGATESKISIHFSVPEGAPAQYMEIKEIKVTEGQCK